MIDAETFTREVEALLPTLYRIARSMLRSETDAQDAVQQALVNAWTRLHTVEPARFRAWVTRIVVNECHNVHRHRARVTPVEQIAETRAYAQPDLDVADAIQGLPDKWRIPFLLKYAADYKEREIAQALRLPLATVKSRLFCARRELRRKLSDQEVSFG